MFEVSRAVLMRLLPLFLAVTSTWGAIYCTTQDENASRKTRNENANKHSNVTGNRNRNRRPSSSVSNSTKAKAANLIIRVSPTDSLLLIDNQQVDNSGENGGVVNLTGLAPIEHAITVRHSGYGDQQLQITLKPGENDPVIITLEPLKGTLSVKPSVEGASIEVRSIDRNQSVGSYAGAIEKIEFPPGEYEFTVSKSGYQSATRAFTIKPAGIVELEPRIDPLPPPVPTPALVTTIASRSTVKVEGKDLVVQISGVSGDTSRTSGTISVTVNRGEATAYVQGSLNGLPSDINFIPLENVAQWSVVDSPSPSNSWSLTVVRVKPKDSKRPISFNINWTAIQNSPDSKSVATRSPPASVSPAQEPVEVLTKAKPIHQVIPTVPPVARSAGIKGIVKVSILVDEEGNVKSAKAFEGPNMLRQAAENAALEWKFKPSTRNGIPRQSTEIIYFTFEGY